jgi:hypothetical protein
MKMNFKRMLVINTIWLLFFSCGKQKNDVPLEFTSRIEVNRNDKYIKYFENITWENRIGLTEEKTITIFIDSCHGLYREYPIKVMIPVLVHRLTNIGLRENLFEWEYIRDYLTKTKNLSDKEYDEYLLSNIDQSKLSNQHSWYSHYYSFHDDILEALIIRQCKLLRDGKDQNIILEDRLLNNYQKTVLKYSRLPHSLAIDSLIMEIAKKEVNGHNLVKVLMQYGTEGTREVKKFITNEKNISNSGKNLLLYYLKEKVKSDLKKAEQIQLLEYLTTDTIYKRRFKNQLAPIAMINHEITGKDLEVCSIEIGIGIGIDIEANKKKKRIYEEEKKARIEEIRQEILIKQNRRK